MRPLLATVLFFLALFVFHANAAIKDIQPLCQNSVDECLSKIRAQQSLLDKNTPPWWDLQVRRFDILFNFQRYDELYALLRPWLEATNLKGMPEYKPLVSLFFGKWLRASGREQEARIALTISLTGLRAQYETMPSPQLGIRILNLLPAANRNEPND